MATDGTNEELLEVGRRPATRGHRAATAIVVGAIAAASIAYLATRSNPTRAPRAVATPALTATPSVVVATAAADDDVPAFVAGVAAQPGPLVDYIRSDSPRGECALVAIGTSPQRSITAVLHAAFPRYRVVDVARVLDQYTGLCTLDLRARDGAGSVLVLEVATPRRGRPPPATVDVATQVEATTDIATVRAITSAGWQVTIGTVGPPSDRPSDQVLRDFVTSNALRW